MVEWRHYRSFPGSPTIYFAVRFRITGATPGCFADLDLDLDFRFQSDAAGSRHPGSLGRGL